MHMVTIQIHGIHQSTWCDHLTLAPILCCNAWTGTTMFRRENSQVYCHSSLNASHPVYIAEVKRGREKVRTATKHKRLLQERERGRVLFYRIAKCEHLLSKKQAFHTNGFSCGALL